MVEKPFISASKLIDGRRGLVAMSDGRGDRDTLSICRGAREIVLISKFNSGRTMVSYYGSIHVGYLNDGKPSWIRVEPSKFIEARKRTKVDDAFNLLKSVSFSFANVCHSLVEPEDHKDLTQEYCRWEYGVRETVTFPDFSTIDVSLLPLGNEIEVVARFDQGYRFAEARILVPDFFKLPNFSKGIDKIWETASQLDI